MPATAKEELGWVIEHHASQSSGPAYYAGGCESATTGARWSSNSLDAIRFARKEDAERANNECLQRAPHRIAEHSWG